MKSVLLILVLLQLAFCKVFLLDSQRNSVSDNGNGNYIRVGGTAGKVGVVTFYTNITYNQYSTDDDNQLPWQFVPYVPVSVLLSKCIDDCSVSLEYDGQVLDTQYFTIEEEGSYITFDATLAFRQGGSLLDLQLTSTDQQQIKFFSLMSGNPAFFNVTNYENIGAEDPSDLSNIVLTVDGPGTINEDVDVSYYEIESGSGCDLSDPPAYVDLVLHHLPLGKGLEYGYAKRLQSRRMANNGSACILVPDQLYCGDTVLVNTQNVVRNANNLWVSNFELMDDFYLALVEPLRAAGSKLVLHGFEYGSRTARYLKNKYGTDDLVYGETWVFSASQNPEIISQCAYGGGVISTLLGNFSCDPNQPFNGPTALVALGDPECGVSYSCQASSGNGTAIAEWIPGFGGTLNLHYEFQAAAFSAYSLACLFFYGLPTGSLTRAGFALGPTQQGTPSQEIVDRVMSPYDFQGSGTGLAAAECFSLFEGQSTTLLPQPNGPLWVQTTTSGPGVPGQDPFAEADHDAWVAENDQGLMCSNVAGRCINLVLDGSKDEALASPGSGLEPGLGFHPNPKQTAYFSDVAGITNRGVGYADHYFTLDAEIEAACIAVGDC